MNRLVKISFLTLKISSIVFILFFLMGTFAAFVLGKKTLSIGASWDILIYAVLLNIAMHLYRKTIMAGDEPGKLITFVLGGMLGPLIFYSCLWTYEVVVDYLSHEQEHIGPFLLTFLIFSTLAGSGMVLLTFMIQNPRRKPTNNRDLPAI